MKADGNELWGRMVRFVERDLWETNLAALDSFRRVLFLQLRVAVLVGLGITRHQLSLHAAALTYITVFGLVPSIAVSFAIFKAFGGLDQAMSVLMPALLDYLAVGTRDVVEGRIQEFVANIHGGAIGGVGSLFLIVSVISLLRNIEYAFNSIWGVRQSRTMFQTVTTYWTMATIAPALLVAGVTLSAAVRRLPLFQWLLQEISGAHLLFATIVPLLLVCAGFALLYAFMPNTRVSVRSALIGGICGGLLWSIAVYLYAVYAARAVTYSAIYGSLGVIPIFLLWLYVTWTIVLVGAEVSFAAERVETYGDELRAQDASDASRRVLAVRIMSEVSRHFLQNAEPPSTAALSRDLHAPLWLVNQLAGELDELGLLRQTGTGDGLVPGRDPHRIDPAEIVTALDNRGTRGTWPSDDGTTQHIEECIRKAEIAARTAWSDLTVATLALGASDREAGR